MGFFAKRDSVPNGSVMNAGRKSTAGFEILKRAGALLGASAGALLLIVTAFAPRETLLADESASASYRITRDSVNQGGQPKAATSYRMNAAIGETSQGNLLGATRRIGDGLMRIYFYPGRIADITAVPGTASGSIRLNWTAPGADGNLRTASKYMVKYSPSPITTQDAFDNAATLFTVAVPNGPGTAETIDVTGLTPGSTYYLAIAARDEDENQGALSNNPSTWSQVAVLAVDIENLNGAPGLYGFGAMQMSSAAVSTSTIRVTNTGSVASTWSLKASTVTAGSPWQLTRGALAQDVFRLSAAFEEVRPSTSDFSASLGYEDRIITTEILATGTTFSVDGSSTGVDVPTGATRNVWFLLETPLASNTSSQQQIQVTVTAN
jgi:hypothetical protein